MSQRKKKPEELTNQELNGMVRDTQAVIDGLEGLDPQTLTPEQAQDRQETLQSAYDLGGVLALEQIRRFMGKLKSKVDEIKARAAQAEGGAGND